VPPGATAGEVAGAGVVGVDVADGVVADVAGASFVPSLPHAANANAVATAAPYATKLL